MLYGMKEVCARVDMTYEGLKYYCNQGLVPNMKRDAGNRRMFDERDIAWIECLIWLRKCGMGIDDMKRYLALCLEGPESIPQRQAMLQAQREQLYDRLLELKDSLKYIEEKEQFYADVLAGRRPYESNLIDV